MTQRVACKSTAVSLPARGALLLALATWAGAAAGQPTPESEQASEAADADVQEAREHFVGAVQLYHDGDLETALEEFNTSYRLNPLPQVLYNIAVVQRDLRRNAEAVETLRRYLEEGRDEPDRRRAVARELLSELERELAEVRIDCAQQGAELFIDGEPTGQTPIGEPLTLSPGSHELELRLDGYETHRQSLDLSGGQQLDLAIALNSVSPPWYRTWWFWTSVGGGVVVLTTIIVLAAVLSHPTGAELGVSVVSAEAR